MSIGERFEGQQIQRQRRLWLAFNSRPDIFVKINWLTQLLISINVADVGAPTGRSLAPTWHDDNLMMYSRNKLDVNNSDTRLLTVF